MNFTIIALKVAPISTFCHPSWQLQQNFKILLTLNSSSEQWILLVRKPQWKVPFLVLTFWSSFLWWEEVIETRVASKCFLPSVNIPLHFCSFSLPLSYSPLSWHLGPVCALASFSLSRSHSVSLHVQAASPECCSPSSKGGFCRASEPQTLMKAYSSSQQFHWRWAFLGQRMGS